MRRFATGLAIAALLLPLVAHATTAPSLSDRIKIDGVLDEYAPDEWVLDGTSFPRELDGDSRWGADNDISRVALTWDHTFLYLAVEGRTFDSFFSVLLSNRAGGLTTLEDAGDFRRAIELPGLPVNLIALASPQRLPDVARADDTHAFSLVDRDAVPAAIAGVRTGTVGFEMAVPWSMLTLSKPVRLVAAITGDVGTGAGDTAPDATAYPDDDRFARAVLDRLLTLDADVDDNRLPDMGVSPRIAVAMYGTSPAIEPAAPGVSVVVDPRTFAPDRGEEANIRLRVKAEDDDIIYVTFSVFSMEGERVRRLYDGYSSRVNDGDLLLHWDGVNDHGDVVRGGAYVVLAEWGNTQGARDGRATAAVVVVR